MSRRHIRVLKLSSVIIAFALMWLIVAQGQIHKSAIETKQRDRRETKQQRKDTAQDAVNALNEDRGEWEPWSTTDDLDLKPKTSLE